LKAQIAAVLIVVALFAGAAIGYFSSASLGTTSQTTTTYQSRSYELTFTQSGVCSPEVWEVPWAVTLNNKTTVAEPANASLPLSNGEFQAFYWENYSIIVFSVANGIYSYSVEPTTSLGQTGNVTVSNADATVTVHSPPVGCTTTVTTTT